MGDRAALFHDAGKQGPVQGEDRGGVGVSSGREVVVQLHGYKVATTCAGVGYKLEKMFLTAREMRC